MDRDDLTPIIPRKRCREPDSDEEDEYERPTQVRRMGLDGQEMEESTPNTTFGGWSYIQFTRQIHSAARLTITFSILGEAPMVDTDEIIPDGTPNKKRGPPTRGERRASKRRKKNPEWEMQLDLKDDGSFRSPEKRG